MKPNIIMIMTDQQRFDTIASLGNSHMITPNLDKIVDGGTVFSNAFAPGATCIASRAATFTGMYAHNTGVYSFHDWCHHKTWVEDLNLDGYHCVNLGKMHCEPMYDDCGFHERRVVENKASNFLKLHKAVDEWERYLHQNGMKRPNDRQKKYEDWIDRYNAITWEYDEKYHSDAFVGDLAYNWLDNWDMYKPLFLQVGFPGPHEPYDPPQEYLDLYKDKDIPEPIFMEGELDNKPPQHKLLREYFKNNYRQESLIDIEKATVDEVKEMRKHYYANITMIDHYIGKIVDKLQEKGMLENTIIIFTSDHGDNLGDHKMSYKWVMYDTVTKVPLLIKDYRNTQNETTEVKDLVNLVDIGPTILNMANIDIPCYLEGKSLKPYVDKDTNVQKQEYVYCEDNYQIMMRSENYKMVYYIGQELGEFYDLTKDPNELNNLWQCSEYKEKIIEMRNQLLQWIAESCYFNGGYKTNMGKDYEMRYPSNDKFGQNLFSI